MKPRDAPTPSASALPSTIPSDIAEGLGILKSWFGKHRHSSSSSASSETSTSDTSTSPSAEPTSSGVGIPDEDDSFEEYILKLHNDFRAAYGAGPLTYNSTLAEYAQHVSDSCDFTHTNGPWGENLAAVSGFDDSTGEGFQEWASEAAYYDWSNPTFSDSTGHFTQTVWKATTEVGCAMSNCPGDTIFPTLNQNSSFLVCEYYTAGNIILLGDPGAYFRINVGEYQNNTSSS
ncbi:hypothetical protein TREMEDRAFT_28045 [Tremella mesenterica DSM 1558]|uniref:uncharacterized protein n=1 Tax=Tremella mesenterica (strain ATCC 24925 / CBS 8224 / DSM 1558 / NBRC 9311 / NRRL Y-6157 / RJB 2259-6 / UBC 559-6) TaxID=578456 RepID=UPI0003F4A1A6|nr:uncharacterized protein TREMEDRAFT_28045 [Tremella mesenterica DSM 1558]EIW71631.1 hypothetical protein TREMEDRAFT_28045 [Tremella mesenterica DSM 1558]